MIARRVMLSLYKPALRSQSVAAPFSTISALRADIIQDMYVKELKAYRAAPPATPMKDAGLPTAFPFPAAPPAPVLVDKAAASATVAEEAEEKEEAWPALVDPIEDPRLYNENWDFSCDNDDGSLLMKRKREVTPADFEEHH